MNTRMIVLSVSFALAPLSAMAVEATTTAPTPKSVHEAAKKDAAVRYAEDRKLCADETASSLRMQCLRDAKAEYSASLKAASENYSKAKAAAAAAAAKPVAAPTAPVPAKAVATKAAACPDCGKVLAVNAVEKDGEGSPLGMIAGGVAGALLGRQVGDGSGKDIATVVGAAGGAYAGHKIEQKMRTSKTWVVRVRFEGGEERSYNFEADPGLAVGAEVKAAGNTVVKR